MTEMVIDPFPLVRDLPPYVIKDQDVTLDDLESGIVTVIANLPEACQVLYRNVAGPKIALDTPDFPDFSQAIERSVRTEGLVGHNLLMKKANHGGGESNFLGTYLRITIGTNVVSLLSPQSLRRCLSSASTNFSHRVILQEFPMFLRFGLRATVALFMIMEIRTQSSRCG